MHEFRPAHVVEEDAALALALREGDEAAVRTLFERYGALVYVVADRVLHDPALAEDVTQHTFLQAWRNADSFEPGRDFAPWLATIARRAAIDVVRRDRRRPTEPLDDPDDATSAPPSAEQIETVWSVRRAVDSLGADEREIVRLQFLEGWTQAEIAQQLDIPIGTVKSRSFRAQRRLSNLLAHLRDDEGAS